VMWSDQKDKTAREAKELLSHTTGETARGGLRGGRRHKKTHGVGAEMNSASEVFKKTQGISQAGYQAALTY